MDYYTSDNDAELKLAEYPPPAFYFMVKFSGFSDYSKDTSFQDVGGISREIKTDDVIEGGENTFVHRLPTQMSHPKLVLKRGIVKKDSELIVWCKSVLEDGLGEPIVTSGVEVVLMNVEGTPIRAWNFTNAYPVKWSVDNFNSTKNEVAIETIELSYNSFTRKDQ